MWTLAGWGPRFLLVFSVVVFIVFGVEAVEEGTSEREDGGSPCQAVAPVKFMVDPQTDCLYELDGEENQAAHLEHNCKKNRQFRRKMHH